MSSSDSVSVFAEGTFEEQLQELLGYTSRGISDEDRTALLQSFQDVVKTRNAPLDEGARRTVFESVLKNTKGLGQGTDKGMCGHGLLARPSDNAAEIEGFFNLLYSHLFILWQVDSSETRQHVIYLLNVISSSPSNSASVKYRM